MNNVEFSKLGKAFAQNSALSHHVMARLSHLTTEEKKRGYLEVALKENKKLVVTFGPDRRSEAERNQAIHH